MANLAELDRVIAHCAKHPEQHDQGTWLHIPPSNWVDSDRGEDELTADWRCHTTACLAGWGAILNGWRPMGPDSDFVVNAADWPEPVMIVAQRIFDLTDGQAHELFVWTRNLDDIRRVVERIRAKEGEAAS